VSFQTAFYIVDGVFLVGLIGYLVFRVVSVRRNPEKDPPNLTPFLDDDALEGRRLERVLGWSLIMVLIIAVALPVYFILEPDRQARADRGFLERSIERGAVLFANKTSPHYDSTLSLLCADCHGADGTGGTAPFVLQPESDKCLQKQNQKNENVPECLPTQVSWQAPDLTLAGLRYTSAQLNQIITYGRPGTPMPAWGVKSGKGAKNEQSIDDLVNFVESIKTTPEKAQKQAAAMVTQYRKDAAVIVDNGKTGSERAGKQKDLEDAQATLAAAQANKSASADEVKADERAVTQAQADLQAAIAYRNSVATLSDGAILFRLNCARCHTKGWSFHVTDPARADLPTLAAQGSGAYGPDLRGDSVTLQFPGEAGAQEQYNWVAIGVPANQGYGVRGISSGRMPHFGRVLTQEQIKEIIAYERAGLVDSGSGSS
jgi:mono/diheme cytochrome c family protein